MITWVLNSDVFLDPLALESLYLTHVAFFMKYNCVQNERVSKLAQMSDSAYENTEIILENFDF